MSDVVSPVDKMREIRSELLAVRDGFARYSASYDRLDSVARALGEFIPNRRSLADMPEGERKDYKWSRVEIDGKPGTYYLTRTYSYMANCINSSGKVATVHCRNVYPRSDLPGMMPPGSIATDVGRDPDLPPKWRTWRERYEAQCAHTARVELEVRKKNAEIAGLKAKKGAEIAGLKAAVDEALRGDA